MNVIFLDRDGVINQEVDYLHKIADFKFIDGIFETCKYFQSLGFKIIIVTNQSGIGRGYYQETDFHFLTNWMLSEFGHRNVEILDVFFCPHGPKSKCKCRKPQPGMLLQAHERYGIDMPSSWMIGDQESDVEAAMAAGISNTILVRSGHIIDENCNTAKFVIDTIKNSKDIIG